MARRTSAARVKANRSYSVEDAADAVGVTQQTVRAWINCGLPAMTAKRPTLILGWALKEFMIRAQQQRKKPLGPGEFFCFRCKQGRRAALGLIDYHSKSPTHGRLQAICEVCEGSLSLNVSTANLPEWRAHWSWSSPGFVDSYGLTDSSRSRALLS